MPQKNEPKSKGSLKANIGTNNQELMKLLDIAGQGVIYISEEHTVKAANRTACQMLRLSPKALIGTKFPPSGLLFLHEDGSLIEADSLPFLTAFQTGKTVTKEVIGITNEGQAEPQWFKATVHPENTNTSETPQQVCLILQEITAQKQLEHNLKERYKELEFFYSISAIAEKEQPLQKMYQEIIDILPKSWQYSEVACGRLIMDGNEYRTKNFSETQWVQSAPINEFGEVFGSIEIYYLEKRPDADEGPFLREERLLLNAIAERVGRITERRHTVEQLRIKNEFITLALQASELGKWQQDFARDSFFFDDVACTHFGFEESIQSSKKVLERIHPEDRKAALKTSADAIKNGLLDPIITEYRILLPDGSIKWLAVNSKVTFIQTKKGLKPISAVGTSQDITNRKKAEEALKKAVESYNLIAEHSDDVIWVFDRKTQKYKYISPSVQKMLGYTPEEVLGMSNSQLFTPASVEIFRKAEQERSSLPEEMAQRSFSIELEQFRKDGSVVPTEITSNFVKEENGQALVIGISRDITRRKHAEYALQESQAKLQAALRSMNDAVFITDFEGMPVEFNDAFVSFHRFKERSECLIDPVKWQEILEVHSMSGKPIPFSEWPANMAIRGISKNNEEFRLLRKDIGVTWIGSYSYSPITDNDGTIVGSVSVSRDITDQVLAKEALQRKSRALDMLSKCNEALVMEQDEKELLDKVCRICVERGNYQFSWVGYAQNDPEKTVLPITHYGFNGSYLDAIKISWAENDYGQGPTGTAIRNNSIELSGNIHTNEKYTPWRDAAEKRGYASSIALPLNVFGKTIGAFMLYSNEVNAFKQDELELLVELAHDISFGIENSRTRDKQIQLQEEVLAYQARFELAEKAAQIGFWEMDLETGSPFWSREVYSLLDQDPEIAEPTEDYFQKFVLDEDKPELENAVGQAIENGQPFEFEFRIHSSAGKFKWLNTKGDTIKDSSGKVVKISGTLQDITHRKQIEIALQENQAKIKAAFTSMTEAIAIIDIQGNIIETNDAFTSIHRFSRKEENPRIVSEYLQNFKFFYTNGKSVPLDMIPVSLALKGETGTNEFTIQRIDGGETWQANYSYAPIRDEREKIAGALIVIRDITAQRKAEEELRKATANYRLISENANDVIWVMDTDTQRFTFFSPSIEKLSGFSPDELRQKSLEDLFSPDSAEKARGMIEQSTKNFLINKVAPLKPLQLDELKKDGTTIPVEIKATLAYDEEGRLLVIGISRDISERLQAEEALRASSETNQAILNATLESVLMMDQSCTILAANATAAKRIGLPTSEIVGKTLFDLFPRAIAEKRQEKLKEVLKRKDLITFEDDREERHFVSNYYPIFDQSGNVKSIVVFAKDNTEEYRVQQILHQTEESRRVLLESIPESIVLIDPDGKVLMANSTAYIRQNIKPEDFLKHPIYDILEPKVARVIKSRIEEVIQNRQPVQFESNYNNRSTVSNIIPIIDEKGEVTQLAISEFDITERKKTEEELALSEHRNKTIVDAIPDTLFRVSRDGTFLDYQSKPSSQLFVPPEEFIGKKIADVMPPDISKKGMEAIEKAFTQNKLQTFEYNLQMEDALSSFEARVVANQNDQEAVLIIRDVTEQRKMVSEIHASEEKYRVLMESLDSVVATIDIEGRFLYMNEVAAAQMGGKPENLIGKKMSELFPPQFAESQMQAIRTVILENKGISHETISVVQGKPRWYHSTIEPLHDENGTVIAALLNSTDIHDLKTAQENLQQMNETLEQRVKERSQEVQDLYDNAPTGYHSLGLDGMILIMNKTELHWLGYERDEVIGKKRYFDLISPGDYPKWVGAFEEFKQKGHIENLEFDLIRKDGSTFPVIINSLARYDENGRYLQSRSTVFDNTDRKAIEAEIRRINNLSDTALELARAGFWYIPVDGTGVYLSSDRLIDIMGNEYRADNRYNIQEGWMRNVELAEPGATITANLEMNDVLAGKKDRYDIVYKFRRPNDGEIIWVHDIGNVVKDASGKPIGITGVTQDITKQKELEDELSKARDAAEAANKAKSTFLANMSHEIRTPMNAILGFAQIMLNGKQLDEKNRSYVEIINRSGEHLLTLINEILEMSKIEAGHVTYTPSVFNLPILIRDIKSMFTPRMEAKQLSLDLDLAHDLPEYIISDENKLKEILINLVGNAFKFTNQGGITLHVRTERDTNSIQSKLLNLYIDIEDTGVGISQEDLPKLFKAFEQVNSGLKNIGGTGLGLAISQGHAKMMGGEITVSSVPNEGSTFHVRLVVQEGEAPEVQPEIEIHEVTGLQPTAGKIKVLVADDNEENRLMVNEMLSPLGLSVVEARNGEEAVKFTGTEHPNLILMDLRMPQKDGYQAAREIKASAAGKEIPIIALTASILELDREKLAANGINDLLRKPFKEKELLASIEALLGPIFVYKITENTPEQKGSAEHFKLTQEMVSTIPVNLLEELRTATISADFDKLMNLIDQIEKISPRVAKKLNTLANDFQYDALLSLFEKGGNLGN